MTFPAGIRTAGTAVLFMAGLALAVKRLDPDGDGINIRTIALGELCTFRYIVMTALARLLVGECFLVILPKPRIERGRMTDAAGKRPIRFKVVMMTIGTVESIRIDMPLMRKYYPPASIIKHQPRRATLPLRRVPVASGCRHHHETHDANNWYVPSLQQINPY